MRTTKEDKEIKARLKSMAIDVLKANDLGDSTKASPRLYPHQWLWDSCFIAIGFRHLSPDHAKREILSLFKGQWKNGMLPNIRFNGNVEFRAGPQLWRSSELADSPDDFETTGITQPPMLAEAIVRVGEKLASSERIAFYQKCLPNLLQYHQWLYRERDIE